MSTITIADSIDSFIRQAGAHSAHTAKTLTPNLARDFAAWLAHDYRDRQGRPLSETSRAIYLVGVGRWERRLFLGN